MRMHNLAVTIIFFYRIQAPFSQSSFPGTFFPSLFPYFRMSSSDENDLKQPLPTHPGYSPSHTSVASLVLTRQNTPVDIDGMSWPSKFLLPHSVMQKQWKLSIFPSPSQAKAQNCVGTNLLKRSRNDSKRSQTQLKQYYLASARTQSEKDC